MISISSTRHNHFYIFFISVQLLYPEAEHETDSSLSSKQRGSYLCESDLKTIKPLMTETLFGILKIYKEHKKLTVQSRSQT